MIEFRKLEVPCGPWKEVATKLRDKYQEAIDRVGNSADSMVMEFWRTADYSSWSIVIRYENDYACVIASGGDLIDTIWSLAQGVGL